MGIGTLTFLASPATGDAAFFKLFALGTWMLIFVHKGLAIDLSSYTGCVLAKSEALHSCQLSRKFDGPDSVCSIMSKYVCADGTVRVGDGTVCHQENSFPRSVFKCSAGIWIRTAPEIRQQLRQKRWLFWNGETPHHSPSFTYCPSNFAVSADARRLVTSSVYWSEPRATDEDNNLKSVIQTSGPRRLESLAEGVHVVQYVAEDTDGRKATCNFYVTVTVTRCSSDARLSTIPYGSVYCSGDMKNVYGSDCAFRCNTGYRLSGSSTLQCNNYGSWSAGFPTCLPVSCGPPPSIANGRISCPTAAYQYPDRCAVTCTRGFDLTGSPSVVTCQATSHWSTNGHCHDVEPPKFPNGCPESRTVFSGPLEAPTAVTWPDPATSDNSGEQATVSSSLPKGSKLGPGDYRISINATDRAGNTESCNFMVTVRARRCPVLSLPQNSNMTCSQGNVEGSVCTVTCPTGNKVQGHAAFTCKSNEMWDASMPECSVVQCPALDVIEGGRYVCSSGLSYTAICRLQCNSGCVPDGLTEVRCADNGTWTPGGTCKDIEPPGFVNGCPSDRLIPEARLGEETKVDWPVIPSAIDNSGLAVNITSDREPGSAFSVGITAVTYTATDSSGNSEACSFNVNVTRQQCDPPNLEKDTPNITSRMVYGCPNDFVFGAVCSVNCPTGFVLTGANSITCDRDVTVSPPTMSWVWPGAMGERPSCLEDRCPPLRPPKNGALSCLLGEKGKDCLLSCDHSWDVIPSHTAKDGYYYCTNREAVWVPNSLVPDCTQRVIGSHVRAEASVFYMTNSCDVLVEELRQLFVIRLNSSVYRDACVGVPMCTPANVEVTCTPVDRARGKRDTGDEATTMLARLRRKEGLQSASSHYLTVKVSMLLPLQDNMSFTEDAYTRYTQTKDKIADTLRTSAEMGELNLHHLLADSDSVATPSLVPLCPQGTVYKQETDTASLFYCVGCSKGFYLPTDAEYCSECPKGHYSDVESTTYCKPCPPRLTTSGPGSRSQEDCTVSLDS